MILGYLVLLFPLAALLSFVCYLPYCLLRRRRGIRAPLVRHLVCYALIGVIWSILFVTLLIGGITLQPGYHLLNLTPFVWLRETYTMGFAQMVEQLAMNVAMLIPMGLLLPAACRRMRAWWKTAAVIALFMLAEYCRWNHWIWPFLAGRTLPVRAPLVEGCPRRTLAERMQPLAFLASSCVLYCLWTNKKEAMPRWGLCVAWPLPA